MLPGEITSEDVREYTTTVLINGIEREVESWSVGRELTGDLPEQVASVGAVKQATGSITWTPQKDVSDWPTTPFNEGSGWIPQPGDRVEIHVTIDGTSYPRFTGLIDKTRGSITGGMTSSLVDDIDDLSVPFSQDSIWDSMPPLTPTEMYRHINSTPMHTIVTAAMEAGFYNRRRHVGPEHVVAPLQGGTYPTAGSLLASEDSAKSGGYPEFTDPETNGWVCTDAAVTWGSAPIPDSSIMQVSLHVDPGHAAAARLEVQYETSGAHRLQVTDSRVIQVLEGDGTTLVESLPMGDDDLTAVARWDGSTITIATESASTTATGTARSGAMGDTSFLADSGAQVSNAAVTRVESYQSLIHPDEPNAIIDCSRTFVAYGRTVLRGIESSTVRDVLDEMSQAMLIAMHLDARGRLVVRSSDRIMGASPVRTLTTAEDVLSLDWELNLLAHRSRVRVKADLPAFNINRDHTVKLWQGSDDRVDDRNDRTEVITPDTDQEWWVSPPELGREFRADAINTGRGSWIGAAITEDDGDSWRWGNDEYTGTFEQIAGRTWAITHSASSIPSGASLVTRATENDLTALWPIYQGKPLPLIRGGSIRFHPGTVDRDAGPTGGTLVHEMAHWHDMRRGITDTTVHRVADYIQSYVAAPNPVITGTEVVPDPRLQLADLIVVESDNYLGASITAAVVGIDEGFGSGGYSMSLGLRITQIDPAGMTYEQWNASAESPLTYGQWIGLTSATYGDFTTTTEDPQ